MERNDALLEKVVETVSAAPPELLPSLVEPTLTAVEMHAGKASALVRASLPAAITVAMFAERKLSIADLKAISVLSQFEEYAPPPKLKLTAAML